MRATELAAKDATWAAWLRRHRGRLFPLDDIDLSRPESLERADDAYWNRAVGIVPPLDQLDQLDGLYGGFVLVGIWWGIGPGIGGTDVRVCDFDGPYNITHRSPLNVGFIHELVGPWQKLADRIVERESDTGLQCLCGFVFEDYGDPCRRCSRCGGCCACPWGGDAVA